MEVNYQYYQMPGVVASYLSEPSLHEAEEALFGRVRDQVQETDILDIGVGTGRTTDSLRHWPGSYVGVDFSENMVTSARERFPDEKILHADARELDFPDQSFDLVVFSFNGIDDVDHADRLMILSEVHRVLRPGGCFIFSSHNLETPLPPAWQVYKPRLPGNLADRTKEFIRINKRYFYRIYNRLKNRRKEVHQPEYSLINDQACSYRLLTYYINLANQLEQLRNAGFEPQEIRGRDGQSIAPGTHPQDVWLYYLAQKPRRTH